MPKIFIESGKLVKNQYRFFFKTNQKYIAKNI